MAAVGLSDVFKYGTRFLAHLLVVVLAGVVLVLTGHLVGDILLLNSGAPGLRLPSSTTGRVGLGIAGLGLLVTVIGLAGLLFKLVADGTAVGTRAVLEEGGELATSDGDETTSEPADDADVSDEPADTPSPDERGSPATAASPTPQERQEPTETTDPTQSAPTSDGPSPPFSQDAAAESQAAPQPPTDPDAGQPPASETEPSQADSGPANGPEPRSEPAGGDDGTGVPDGTDTGNAEGSSEWTPPDPEEFEQHQSTRPDQQSGEASSDPFADDSTGGFDDDTRVVDEGQIDEPADEATTWDDLRDSSGESNTGSSTDPTGADESAEEDWSTSNPFGDEPAGDAGSPQADEDTQDAYDEEFVEEESTEGANYTFETEGGDDPLSDALDEE